MKSSEMGELLLELEREKEERVRMLMGEIEEKREVELELAKSREEMGVERGKVLELEGNVEQLEQKLSFSNNEILRLNEQVAESTEVIQNLDRELGEKIE